MFKQNPKVIGFLPGRTHSYQLPTYKVVDGSIEDGEGIQIDFCKGNKEDAIAERQEGVFVESILAMAKIHLKSVNVGDLESLETHHAIKKIEEALMWLQSRAENRMLREVQGTYRK